MSYSIDAFQPLLMQTLDALQQALDAVMKKTGDAKEADDEAEKLLETMKGHNAAMTKILLASPIWENVLQQVEQMVDWGSLSCNACNIGFHSNITLAAHKESVNHKKRAYALAMGHEGDA